MALKNAYLLQAKEFQNLICKLVKPSGGRVEPQTSAKKPELSSGTAIALNCNLHCMPTVNLADVQTHVRGRRTVSAGSDAKGWEGVRRLGTKVSHALDRHALPRVAILEAFNR